MAQRVDMPGNRSNSPEPQNNFRRNFWTTTGIVTIAAAVIGATATLIAAKASGNHPQASPTTAAAPAATTAPPAPAPADGATPPPSTANAVTDTGIYWQGSFVFDNYADFDDAPPHNDGGDLIQDTQGNLGLDNDGSRWTGATPPTKAQCTDAIATQAEESVPLETGTQLCYRSHDGRIVYFKVTKNLGRTSDDVLSNIRFQLNVVVWKR